MAPQVLTCHRETVDLMITFEAESLARHTLSVVEGGGMVYNTAGADTPLERIPFLDERVRTGLTGYPTARS